MRMSGAVPIRMHDDRSILIGALTIPRFGPGCGIPAACWCAGVTADATDAVPQRGDAAVARAGACVAALRDHVKAAVAAGGAAEVAEAPWLRLACAAAPALVALCQACALAGSAYVTTLQVLLFKASMPHTLDGWNGQLSQAVSE